MPSTVMTTKGQVTIPVEVRDDMGLKTGDRLEFTRHPETGVYEMSRKTGSVLDLIGMLKYDGPPVSIEQMNEDIGTYLAEDDERIKREYRELMKSEKSS